MSKRAKIEAQERRALAEALVVLEGQLEDPKRTEKAKDLKEAAAASRGAVLEAGRRLSSVDGTAEAARLAAREQTQAAF